MKNSPKLERGRELMALRAVEGLSADEQLELDLLCAEEPALATESMDLAAAAIELAYAQPEPMPPALRQRLSAQAAAHFSGTEPETEASETSTAGLLTFPATAPVADPAPRRQAALGWWAAAACLLLAVLGWWPRSTTDVGLQGIQMTPAERAAQLVQSDGTVVYDWIPTEDPLASGVSGKVIWNTARQEGYMQFSGLESNDPERFQYQLWIFDLLQDERYPIDGGVFDIPADGDVVVPIDSRLEVTEPTLFAVTVEKPGGVVVSSRERLVALAPA